MTYAREILLDTLVVFCGDLRCNENDQFVYLYSGRFVSCGQLWCLKTHRYSAVVLWQLWAAVVDCHFEL